MTDTTKIQGPVTIADNSRERVAFEIAKYIDNASDEAKDDFLTLFARCLITIAHPQLGADEIKQRAKSR